jgi:hypothetical protein
MVEYRAFGFCKRAVAGLAFVPLATRFGLSELDNVFLTLALALAIVSTHLVWTKIAHLGKLWHFILLLPMDASIIILYPSTLKRETINSSFRGKVHVLGRSSKSID